MNLTGSERRLLSNCARIEIPVELVGETKALVQENSVRWPQLIAASRHHGVASLLYKNLERIGWDDAVPASHRQTLFLYYQRSTQHTLHLLKALVELLDRLSSAGLAVIVMKGPDLVYRVYGDPTLRGFRDLDFMVRSQDVDRAKAVLTSAGYRLAPSLHSERLARRYHFNLPFEAEGDVPLRIDLHWELTDRFAGYTWDTQGIWDRSSAAGFSGQQARVLSLEDLITYLAVHIDVHGYLNQALAARGGIAHVLLHPYSENRLIWFVDLYEILRGSTARIDWKTLVDRAREAGVGPALSTTLRLLNQVFMPLVDRPILDGLGLPRPSLGKRVLLSRLMIGIDRAEQTAERAARWEALVALRHGVQFRLVRLLDLWGYIFPSLEQLVRRYRLGDSRWAATLHYPWHVVRALMSCIVWATELLFHFVRRATGARSAQS